MRAITLADARGGMRMRHIETFGDSPDRVDSRDDARPDAALTNVR
jgi:hypothetical protein